MYMKHWMMGFECISQCFHCSDVSGSNCNNLLAHFSASHFLSFSIEKMRNVRTFAIVLSNSFWYFIDNIFFTYRFSLSFVSYLHTQALLPPNIHIFISFRSHRYTSDKLPRACMAFSGLYPVISTSLFRLCEGWDSNSRIPSKMGPKPIAFDLAGLPSHAAVFDLKCLFLILTLPLKPYYTITIKS